MRGIHLVIRSIGDGGCGAVLCGKTFLSLGQIWSLVGTIMCFLLNNNKLKLHMTMILICVVFNLC